MNHPLTDLNIIQSAFGPYASRSKCSKSGVTPLAGQRPITHRLVRCSSYLVVQSSILAEVQGRCCHSSPFQLCQGPGIHLCEVEPKHIYPPSQNFLSRSEILPFSQRCFFSICPPILFLTFTCAVPLPFFYSGPTFSLITAVESPKGISCQMVTDLKPFIFKKNLIEKNHQWGTNSEPLGPPKVTKKHYIPELGSSAVLLP